MHVNLPPVPGNRRRADISETWRKPFWVTMGVLAPEIVVYIAWNQYWSARLMTKEMESLQKEASDAELHDSPADV
jgi:hypothetical protein